MQLQILKPKMYILQNVILYEHYQILRLKNKLKYNKKIYIMFYRILKIISHILKFGVGGRHILLQEIWQ